MKKAKRFLTGLLSAALALSLCAMPAMAEESGTQTTPQPSTAVWTRDTGSITVHKYEFNGLDSEQKPATGESNDTAPDGANPLKDATFTAYQVWDKDALSEYYNGSSDKALPNVDTLIEKKNGNYVVKSETDTPKVAEGTTDANGIATLNKDIRDESSTGLPLGLYLVVETQSPASVTTRCKPFLVSVPMTRIGATKPGEEWLYDVHVYPKNKTTYGDVTLEKYGRVGDDDNTKVPLDGVTFELYKYNKTGDATAYTVGSPNWTKVVKSATSSGEGQGADLNLTTENGKITVNNLTQGYYCFVETDLGANQKYILNQTPHYFKVNADSTSETFTFTSTGTLLIDSDKAANLTIEVVDTQPDVDKKVKNRNPKNDKDTWVDASDYSVGDQVPYTITVKVPHELLAAYANDTDVVLTVKDTPKNLWVVEDTIEAKPSGENAEAVTAGVNITVDDTESADHGKGFTATFTKSALNALVGTGDTFVITYKAELKDTAVMTVAGNPNTVSLEYSNKIGTDGKIDTGSKKEIHNSAVVYTFKITIEKRGENATGALLDGVTFDLYKRDDNGTVKGSDIGFTDENKEKKFVKVKENLTTVKGYVSASGLANGDYYLVETKTADKTYNLLSGPVKVTLNVQYTTTWTKTEIYDNDGNLIHRDERETKETFGNTVDEKKEGYTKIVVINRKGFNLPTTGGFGTLLFSGIGVLLVVAGVGVLLSLKKKNRA